MRITKVELRNWGPHEHLLLETDDPIVGIIGANGAGKSNLLQALNYALTGNLNKRNGTSYIRNFGMEGGATFASVEVTFVSGENEGRIYREIGAKSTKRELHWDGAVYKKADDVKNTLKTALGADDAALASAVFIQQGEIAALVKGTPSERNEIFRKLMNLNFVDARSNDIQSKIEAIRAGIKDYSGELALLDAQLSETVEELNNTEALAANVAWEGVSAVLDAAMPVLEKRRDAQTAIDNATHRSIQAREELAAKSGGETVDEIKEGWSRLVAARELARTEVSTIRSRRLSEINVAKLKSQSTAQTLKMEELFGTCVASPEEVAAEDQRLQKEYDRALELIRAKEERDTAELAANNAAAAADAAGKDLEAAETRWEKGAEELAAFKLEKDPLLDALKWKLEGVRLRSRAAGADHGAECPCCGRKFSADENISLEDLHKLELDTQTQYTDLMKERKSLEDAIDEAKLDHRTAEITLKRALLEKKQAEAVLDACVVRHRDVLHVSHITSACSIEELHGLADEAKKKWDSYLNKWGSYKLEWDKRCMLLNQVRSAELELEEMPESGASEEEMNLEIARLDTEISVLRVKLDNVERLVRVISDADKDVEKYTELYRSLWNDESHDQLVRADVRSVLNWDDDRDDDELDLSNIVEARVRAAELETEYNTLRARAGILNDKVEALEEEKSKLEEKINKNATREELIKTLEKVRLVTGKNGAPLAYMTSVFNGIVAIVQDLLDKMGANFTVEADPNNPVTFVFTRTDNDTGYTMTQDQLSGGQAVRLALALLIASQQVILPDVGLLVLDEPSSHIDAEGVEQMRDMLKDLGAYLQSAHMQIVMVDHNDTLIGAVDNTITL